MTEGELPIPWRSLHDDENMDPLRSPSAGMIPPNFRAFLASEGSTFDPPPAYGMNGYKNHSHQHEEQLSDDERRNMNDNNNNNIHHFVDDAWYLDGSGDRGNVRFTRNQRNRSEEPSNNASPLQSVVTPDEIRNQESKGYGMVLDPANMSTKFNKF